MFNINFWYNVFYNKLNRYSIKIFLLNLFIILFIIEIYLVILNNNCYYLSLIYFFRNEDIFKIKKFNILKENSLINKKKLKKLLFILKK
jgi:hypothetical protein